MFMKRYASLFLLAIAIAGCAEKPADTSGTGTSNPSATNETKPSEPEVKSTTPEITPPSDLVGAKSDLGDAKPLDGEEIAVIETKEGQIWLRFYADVAPKHVENFKQLARKGFYDGTKFHRIIPKFMIQGGDPLTKNADPADDGTGGPGYQIDAEFSPLTHERGILSMARSNDPNSAGSQFFIVHAPSYHLDTQYTVFGRVIKQGTEKEGEEPAGLKVVDKIVNGKAEGDKAVNPVEMKVSIRKWPFK